jgi:hypothetical protein
MWLCYLTSNNPRILRDGNRSLHYVWNPSRFIPITIASRSPSVNLQRANSGCWRTSSRPRRARPSRWQNRGRARTDRRDKVPHPRRRFLDLDAVACRACPSSVSDREIHVAYNRLRFNSRDITHWNRAAGCDIRAHHHLTAASPRRLQRYNDGLPPEARFPPPAHFGWL